MAQTPGALQAAKELAVELSEKDDFFYMPWNDKQVLKNLHRNAFSTENFRTIIIHEAMDGSVICQCQSYTPASPLEPTIIKIGDWKQIEEEAKHIQLTQHHFGTQAPRLSAFVHDENACERGGLMFRVRHGTWQVPKDLGVLQQATPQSLNALYATALHQDDAHPKVLACINEVFGSVMYEATYRSSEKMSVATTGTGPSNLWIHYDIEQYFEACVFERDDAWIKWAGNEHPSRVTELELNLPDDEFALSAEAQFKAFRGVLTAPQAPKPGELSDRRSSVDNQPYSMISEAYYAGIVHGNLSGENVLVDSAGLTWVVNLQPRFAKIGHVLKDIAKLMTHVLFEYTPITSSEQLMAALKLTEELGHAQNLLQEEECVAMRDTRKAEHAAWGEEEKNKRIKSLALEYKKKKEGNKVSGEDRQRIGEEVMELVNQMNVADMKSKEHGWTGRLATTDQLLEGTPYSKTNLEPDSDEEEDDSDEYYEREEKKALREQRDAERKWARQVRLAWKVCRVLFKYSVLYTKDDTTGHASQLFFPLLRYALHATSYKQLDTDDYKEGPSKAPYWQKKWALRAALGWMHSIRQQLGLHEHHGHGASGAEGGDDGFAGEDFTDSDIDEDEEEEKRRLAAEELAKLQSGYEDDDPGDVREYLEEEERYIQEVLRGSCSVVDGTTGRMLPADSQHYAASPLMPDSDAVMRDTNGELEISTAAAAAFPHLGEQHYPLRRGQRTTFDLFGDTVHVNIKDGGALGDGKGDAEGKQQNEQQGQGGQSAAQSKDAKGGTVNGETKEVYPYANVDVYSMAFPCAVRFTVGATVATKEERLAELDGAEEVITEPTSKEGFTVEQLKEQMKGLNWREQQKMRKEIKKLERKKQEQDAARASVAQDYRLVMRGVSGGGTVRRAKIEGYDLDVEGTQTVTVEVPREQKISFMKGQERPMAGERKLELKLQHANQVLIEGAGVSGCNGVYRRLPPNTKVPTSMATNEAQPWPEDMQLKFVNTSVEISRRGSVAMRDQAITFQKVKAEEDRITKIGTSRRGRMSLLAGNDDPHTAAAAAATAAAGGGGRKNVVSAARAAVNKAEGGSGSAASAADDVVNNVFKDPSGPQAPGAKYYLCFDGNEWSMRCSNNFVYYATRSVRSKHFPPQEMWEDNSRNGCLPIPQVEVRYKIAEICGIHRKLLTPQPVVLLGQPGHGCKSTAAKQILFLLAERSLIAIDEARERAAMKEKQQERFLNQCAFASNGVREAKYTVTPPGVKVPVLPLTLHGIELARAIKEGNEEKFGSWHGELDLLEMYLTRPASGFPPRRVQCLLRARSEGRLMVLLEDLEDARLLSRSAHMVLNEYIQKKLRKEVRLCITSSTEYGSKEGGGGDDPGTGMLTKHKTVGNRSKAMVPSGSRWLLSFGKCICLDVALTSAQQRDMIAQRFGVRWVQDGNSPGEFVTVAELALRAAASKNPVTQAAAEKSEKKTKKRKGKKKKVKIPKEVKTCEKFMAQYDILPKLALRGTQGKAAAMDVDTEAKAATDTEYNSKAKEKYLRFSRLFGHPMLLNMAVSVWIDRHEDEQKVERALARKAMALEMEREALAEHNKLAHPTDTEKKGGMAMMMRKAAAAPPTPVPEETHEEDGDHIPYHESTRSVTFVLMQGLARLLGRADKSKTGLENTDMLATDRILLLLQQLALRNTTSDSRSSSKKLARKRLGRSMSLVHATTRMGMAAMGKSLNTRKAKPQKERRGGIRHPNHKILNEAKPETLHVVAGVPKVNWGDELVRQLDDPSQNDYDPEAHKHSATAGLEGGGAAVELDHQRAMAAAVTAKAFEEEEKKKAAALAHSAAARKEAELARKKAAAAQADKEKNCFWKTWQQLRPLVLNGEFAILGCFANLGGEGGSDSDDEAEQIAVAKSGEDGEDVEAENASEDSEGGKLRRYAFSGLFWQEVLASAEIIRRLGKEDDGSNPQAPTFARATKFGAVLAHLSCPMQIGPRGVVSSPCFQGVLALTLEMLGAGEGHHTQDKETLPQEYYRLSDALLQVTKRGKKDVIISREPLLGNPVTVRTLLGLAEANLHLVHLDLHDTGLPSLPDSIGCLVKLTELKLDQNELTQLPAAIGKLKKLTLLSAAENDIGPTIPDEIGDCCALQLLQLEQNKLTHVPASLGRLRALVELYLGSNDIGPTIPDAIGGCINLVRADFEKNQLVSFPSTVGNWTKLHTLRLERNKLETLPVEMAKLAMLHDLYIQHNHINAADLPDELGELDAVRLLNLDENLLDTLPALVISSHGAVY
jgi:hypothetical protein